MGDVCTSCQDEYYKSFTIPYNKLKLAFHQLDVKNAFLNGELEDMQLSHGFEKNYGREKVCMLHQLLYALKQSLRAWFDHF